MRILHFIEGLRSGGKERQMAALLKGLSRQPGWTSALVCMSRDDFYLGEVRKLPVRVEFLERRIRWDPSVFLRLGRLVKEICPDLIHAESMMPVFYALPVAKAMGIPLLNGSIRNAFSEGDFRWRLENRLLRLSDFRLANSRAGLESRGLREDSPRNFVVHNGFDFERLEEISLNGAPPTGLEGAQGRPVAGMVAEISPYKDYPTFIRAAAIAQSKRPEILFVAVGGGAIEECRRLARREGAKVAFLGERADVERLVSGFDVGVLATFTEGISNAVMEYMAMAKPVVATDGGGTRELVLDRQTGYLVPARDPEALAARILELIDQPEQARRMGQSGLERLRESFSLERFTKRMLSVYEAVARA